MLLIIAIVVAVGCLAIGLVTGQALPCWVALAVSLVAALSFGFLLLRGRRSADTSKTKVADTATREGTCAAEATDQPPSSDSGTETSDDRGGAGRPGPPSGDAGEPVPVSGGSHDVVEWVKVARGRRRFHLDSCSLLDGKTVDEIGIDEARDEGFTACTKCIPDLAMVTGPGDQATFRGSTTGRR